MKRYGRFLVLLFGLISMMVACTGKMAIRPKWPLSLATFSRNDVSVSIVLEKDGRDQTWLAATFTPSRPGFHLYSAALPRTGVNGEGRPTLLELSNQAKVKPVGELLASEAAEVSSMGTDALLVYPAGPVTLRLPVVLPAGNSWVQDQVSLTYEACSDTTCLTPVVDQWVTIDVPSAGLVGQ